LAAWDPCAGEDPSLLQIGSVLQGHWPTFRGAFTWEPLTLYRAVVLESVMRAMELQGVLAVAVNLVAANILPQLKVGQVKRSFWIDGHGETFSLSSLAELRGRRAFPERFDWLSPDMLRKRIVRGRSVWPGLAQVDA